MNDTLFREYLNSWVGNNYTFAALLAVVILCAWGVAAWHHLRRGQAFLQAAGQSVRGEMVNIRPPGARGFFVHVQPPPDPFLHLALTFQITANPVEWLFWLLMGRQTQLVIQATLRERPRAELIWQRGKIPGRALSRAGSPTLWVQQHLDFLRYEYATRGINTGAIVHVFTDLQTRFGPLLEKVSIQADARPEVEIVLRTNGLNPEEIPALITTIRSAGRAALLR